MRRYWIPAAAGLVLLLFACGLVYGLTHTGQQLSTPNQGSGADAGLLQAPTQHAPDFTGIVDWENSKPLTLARLRGKVVLVDFWTYSCINCQRTFPYLRQWYQAYKDQGLVIVGVHSPEFDFEKDVPNIRQAIKHYDVQWPVAVDSNMATWNAYDNQYWPAEYLIDKDGFIRHVHFGEGEYDQSEKAIRALLIEAGHNLAGTASPSAAPVFNQAQSPEMYAGAGRGFNGVVEEAHKSAKYQDPGPAYANGKIYWQGTWTFQDEFSEHSAGSDPGADYSLINFSAAQVHMVAATADGSTQQVFIDLDGKPVPQGQGGTEIKYLDSGLSYVNVDRSDLYTLIQLPAFSQHVLKVSPTKPGFRLFTYTFGS